MYRTRTIAIVGAGFSGTLVAANLLKSQHWTAIRVVLIERSARVARGKAYADRGFPYLLNVPAGRMSADSRAPLDFLTFAQHRLAQATADSFLPRALYGEYLEATLLDAQLLAPPHVEFERVQGEVCGIEKTGDGSVLDVKFADGRTLSADDVVLALGNPAPAALPGTASLGSRYTADPWAQPLKFLPGEAVLLVGSGLTMVDVTMAAAYARAPSDDHVVIHSISRHGLMPLSQTSFSHEKCKSDARTMLRAAQFSALTLLRSVRELVDETERRGGDWREAITFVRSVAPALWRGLAPDEKRRMLRHARPYWEVHRHRVPSETLAQLQRLRRRRELNTHAGRLQDFELAGDKIKVTWKPRGGAGQQTLLVDRVINCTGPDYDPQKSREPLIRSLLSQGLLVSDPLHLGIRTGENGALIEACGRQAHNLFYVGPMLRADYWEATAVQELRTHAKQLADYLSAPLGRMPPVLRKVTTRHASATASWAAAGTA